MTGKQLSTKWALICYTIGITLSIAGWFYPIYVGIGFGFVGLLFIFEYFI